MKTEGIAANLATIPAATNGVSIKGAVASLSLSVLLPSLGTSIANGSLPMLAAAFDTTFSHVQWVVLAYLLAVTALVVSAGRLGDLINRRRVLLFGITLFILASALSGFAPVLWLLVIARALQGVGAAVMMALTLAFVGDTVPKGKTGAAMGLLGTMSAIGTSLGPSLGGFLIAGIGWPAIFFINIPLGVLALLLAYWYLPAHLPSTPRSRIDVPGTMLLAIALAAYALAMTIGKGSFAPVSAALLVIAVSLGGLFLFVERKVASPLIPLAMFRGPVLCRGFAMSFLVSAVVMATLVVGPFYLTGALHLEYALVGLVLTVGPLVAAVTGTPAGRLSDRFGAGRTTVAGLAAMVIGTVSLSVMPSSIGVPGFLLPIAVTSAGYALFQTSNNALIMASAGPERRGMVSGVLNLSRNLGLVTGTSVLGAVFAFAAGTNDISNAEASAIAHGMRSTFTVAALFVAMALMLATTTKLRRFGHRR